jgi:hypothetical protein
MGSAATDLLRYSLGFRRKGGSSILKSLAGRLRPHECGMDTGCSFSSLRGMVYSNTVLLRASSHLARSEPDLSVHTGRRYCDGAAASTRNGSCAVLVLVLIRHYHGTGSVHHRIELHRRLLRRHSVFLQNAWRMSGMERGVTSVAPALATFLEPKRAERCCRLNGRARLRCR